MINKRKEYKFILTILLSVIFTITFNKAIYSQKYTEYEVKAAYIFNFAKFVEWPDSLFQSKTSPIILGIYNGDPFGDILKMTFNDRLVNGRKWVIKYFKDYDKIEKCHILFIPQIDQIELQKLLNIVRNKSILTVGDNIKDFGQSGGMINFTAQNSKYRFEININEAAKVKLVISSKLLVLSKIVKTNEIKF